MVKEFYQVPKEQVLAEHGKKGQGQRVTGHSNQGPNRIRYATSGMFREIAATEQGAFQQITARAP